MANGRALAMNQQDQYHRSGPVYEVLDEARLEEATSETSQTASYFIKGDTVPYAAESPGTSMQERLGVTVEATGAQ